MNPLSLGQSGSGTPMINETERQQDTSRSKEDKHMIQVHGVRAKRPPPLKTTSHLRKPSGGLPLNKLQKTDAIFNAFVDQHMDFVKDPNEVKILDKTKAWAQDMVENISNDDKGQRALHKFIHVKHI